ncbi:hypothetical protein I4F81_003228 [Pyropia yezoensis]|uniref:Uncharacterized protein n=1 Tax=Pyropia yezoensis TaxID=2788 RepID=A0ACC3BRM6_PYRYE|nr:hypothetical protein I4F81_003228 [Neopyropia yezoensis]
MVSGRDSSLRSRLIEFMALFKFVTDTMVKKECTDPVLRDKVDHPYKDLTPDVVRGKTVSFNMASGKRVSSSTPMFRNSREMNTTSALAVVLLMKHLKDPFTLWLIGLFAGGAMPPEKLLTTKNRARGRPELAVSGVKRPRLDTTVEVFGVVCEVGRATEFYPFTNAFYESLAYSKYRKRHFSDDLILPRTMGDLAGADRGEPRRNTVLWDSRYISN